MAETRKWADIFNDPQNRKYDKEPGAWAEIKEDYFKNSIIPKLGSKGWEITEEQARKEFSRHVYDTAKGQNIDFGQTQPQDQLRTRDVNPKEYLSQFEDESGWIGAKPKKRKTGQIHQDIIKEPVPMTREEAQKILPEAERGIIPAIAHSYENSVLFNAAERIANKFGEKSARQLTKDVYGYEYQPQGLKEKMAYNLPTLLLWDNPVFGAGAKGASMLYKSIGPIARTGSKFLHGIMTGAGAFGLHSGVSEAVRDVDRDTGDMLLDVLASTGKGVVTGSIFGTASALAGGIGKSVGDISFRKGLSKLIERGELSGQKLADLIKKTERITKGVSGVAGLPLESAALLSTHGEMPNAETITETLATIASLKLAHRVFNVPNIRSAFEKVGIKKGVKVDDMIEQATRLEVKPDEITGKNAERVADLLAEKRIEVEKAKEGEPVEDKTSVEQATKEVEEKMTAKVMVRESIENLIAGEKIKFTITPSEMKPMEVAQHQRQFIDQAVKDISSLDVKGLVRSNELKGMIKDYADAYKIKLTKGMKNNIEYELRKNDPEFVEQQNANRMADQEMLYKIKKKYTDNIMAMDELLREVPEGHRKTAMRRLFLGDPRLSKSGDPHDYVHYEKIKDGEKEGIGMIYSEAEVNAIKDFTEVIDAPKLKRALMNPNHFLAKYAPEFKKLMVDQYRVAEVMSEEMTKGKIKEIEKFEKEMKLTPQERKNIDTYGLSRQTTVEGVEIGKATIKEMNREKLIKLNKWRIRTGRKPVSELPKGEIKEDVVLSEREQTVWDYKQRTYKETLKKMNLVREMIGMKPIEGIEDYDALFRRFSVAERMGFEPIQAEVDKWNTPEYDIHPDDISFIHKKLRQKSTRAVKLGDPLTGLKHYIRSANKYIYTTPYQAKMRGLMETLTAKDGSKISLRESNPYAHEFLQRTLDYIGGTLSNFEKKYSKLNAIANKVAGNLGISVILANPNVFINQLGALYLGMHPKILGPKYMFIGMSDVMTPGGRAFAQRESNHIKTRKSGDVFVSDFRQNQVAEHAAEIGKISHKAKKFIGDMTMLVDYFVAQATFLGAYKKGLEVKAVEGYTGERLEEEAKIYADDITIKVNASASKIDRVPMQRSPVGKLFSLFQTYPINAFNVIADDIMGLKRGYRTKAYGVDKEGNPLTETKVKYSLKEGKFNAMKNMAIYFAVVYGGGELYRALGKNNPSPDPFGALDDAIENGEDWTKGLIKAGQHLLANMPIMGGNIIYGGDSVGGPAPRLLKDGFDILVEFADLDQKENQSDEAYHKKKANLYEKLAFTMGRLAGIPGVQGVKNYLNAEKRKMRERAKEEREWKKIMNLRTSNKLRKELNEFKLRR